MAHNTWGTEVAHRCQNFVCAFCILQSGSVQLDGVPSIHLVFVPEETVHT